MSKTRAAAVPPLSAEGACKLLGVSRQTLYAYVSRGLVRAFEDPADARRSLYHRRDLEGLLARKRRGRSRRAVAASTLGWGEPVLASSITSIADGRFFYRGADAVEWSRTASLEETAERLAGTPVAASAARQRSFVPADLPSPLGRMLRALADAAAERKGRDDAAAAGRLLRRVALSAAGTCDDGPAAIHDLLARSWMPDPRAPDLLRRALVLSADHELNASTYATRVAASTGARLPACLLAGLATLSGPRHGGMVARCRTWMVRAARCLGPAVQLPLPPDGTAPPGFGHPLYPDGDPRAAELLDRCRVPAGWAEAIRRVREETGLAPSLDLGLAAVERELALPIGAGFALFAVGRTAGWLAHALEQRESPGVIRPRAFEG